MIQGFEELRALVHTNRRATAITLVLASQGGSEWSERDHRVVWEYLRGEQTQRDFVREVTRACLINECGWPIGLDVISGESAHFLVWQGDLFGVMAAERALTVRWDAQKLKHLHLLAEQQGGMVGTPLVQTDRLELVVLVPVYWGGDKGGMPFRKACDVVNSKLGEFAAKARRVEMDRWRSGR